MLKPSEAIWSLTCWIILRCKCILYVYTILYIYIYVCIYIYMYIYIYCIAMRSSHLKKTNVKSPIESQLVRYIASSPVFSHPKSQMCFHIELKVDVQQKITAELTWTAIPYAPCCWNICQHLPHRLINHPSFVGQYTIHEKYMASSVGMTCPFPTEWENHQIPWFIWFQNVPVTTNQNCYGGEFLTTFHQLLPSHPHQCPRAGPGCDDYRSCHDVNLASSSAHLGWWTVNLVVGCEDQSLWKALMENISGWWFQPTPLKNDGVKVSWDDEIPKWMEK